MKRFHATGFALHSKRTCGRNVRTKQGTPDKIWARLKTSPGKSLSQHVQQTGMSTSLKEHNYCICNRGSQSIQRRLCNKTNICVSCVTNWPRPHP